MINYVMVGTNRYTEAVAFYDHIMVDMGATRVYANDKSSGWGWGMGTAMFIVTRPYNKEPATVGNGTMAAFDVPSAETVDRLHARVLALGGTSEGKPGPRGDNLYIAYWRDLDGNKFNFICYKPVPGRR
jgi:catechol 2,3-dioxygenase-like lactoylglutathione lyase family enzyme